GSFEYVFTPDAGEDCAIPVNISIEIIIYYNVEITIAADQTEVTEGESVTFTATPVSGGTNPEYAWFVNGDLVPGETSVTFTYVPVDGDVVYATLLSDIECAGPKPAESNKETITVNPAVEDLVITADIVPIACFGESTG